MTEKRVPKHTLDSTPIWQLMGYASPAAYHADPKNAPIPQVSLSGEPLAPPRPPAAHGVAIICECTPAGVYAYPERDTDKGARIARQVPSGFFIEWWPQEGIAHAGRSDADYARGAGPGHDKLRWFNWNDALCWCEHEARRGKRKVA